MDEEVHFAGSPLDEYLNSVGGELAGSCIPLNGGRVDGEQTQLRGGCRGEPCRWVAPGTLFSTTLAKSTAAQVSRLFEGRGLIPLKELEDDGPACDDAEEARQYVSDELSEIGVAADALPHEQIPCQRVSSGTAAAPCWLLFAVRHLTRYAMLAGGAAALAAASASAANAFGSASVASTATDRCRWPSSTAFSVVLAWRGMQFGIAACSVWPIAEFIASACHVVGWWRVLTSAQLSAATLERFWATAEDAVRWARTLDAFNPCCSNTDRVLTASSLLRCRDTIAESVWDLHQEVSAMCEENGALSLRPPVSPSLPFDVLLRASLAQVWELHARLLECSISRLHQDARSAAETIRGASRGVDRPQRAIERELWIARALTCVQISTHRASSQIYQAQSALCLTLWSLLLGITNKVDPGANTDVSSSHINDTVVDDLADRVSLGLDAMDEELREFGMHRHPGIREVSSVSPLAPDDGVSHTHDADTCLHARGLGEHLQRDEKQWRRLQPSNIVFVHEAVGDPCIEPPRVESRVRDTDVDELAASRERRSSFATCLRELRCILDSRHELSSSEPSRGLPSWDHAAEHTCLEADGDGPEEDEYTSARERSAAQRRRPVGPTADVMQALEISLARRRASGHEVATLEA
eukprot:TRINITY_DN15326_c0_g3_i1.p1 TRINITY_DN15326_c0_g3~~TRINITY_DN15326_c0_g3_i1.p1  ORF type:complete len:642 (-),score=103.06 TRINITY_DN15326_c0_g3_i1:124-2049(-)